MEANASILVLGILVAVALLVFLIYRNTKDKEELEHEMDDYPNKKEFHSRKEEEEKM